MPALITYRTTVQEDWVDYNGHLRDAFYLLIFSYATDALMERIGLDAASLRAQVEAKHEGYAQVLWLDGVERKYIEEVGTMNIFFKINDELITPELPDDEDGHGTDAEGTGAEDDMPDGDTMPPPVTEAAGLQPAA